MLKLEEDYITEKNHILKATGRIYRRQLEIGAVDKCKLFALLHSINIQQ